MNIRLWLAGVWIPPSRKQKIFQALFHTAAEAFRMPEPDLRSLAPSEWLPAFAALTSQGAHGMTPEIAGSAAVRLRSGARRIGGQLRNDLHIRSPRHVMKALQILYSHIGIDFRRISPDKAVIRRCFFSAVYTPSVCSVMEAMDRGLAEGLAGGGSLTFDQRITEGHAACRATLVFPERRCARR